MKGKEIVSGNECRFTYFATNGCAEYTIITSDTGEDECSVIYDDGLYKLYKNGELCYAATQVLIKVIDKTKTR